MKITPLGAAGEVTGSSFLVESGEKNFLLIAVSSRGIRSLRSATGAFPLTPGKLRPFF